MIHRFSVRRAGVAEPDVERVRQAFGLPDLELWLDYYIEFDGALSAAESVRVCQVLGDQIGVVAIIDQPFPPGALTVLHRRGVVDNESTSIVSMCELLGLRARAGKVARCYWSSSPELREIVEATAYNSSIEEIYDNPSPLNTLVPAGTYLPAEYYDLLVLCDEELDRLGGANGRNLSRRQMERIRQIQDSLGLPSVTDTLLEALDARWSDHCAHVTWQSLGNLLGRLVAASEYTANPNIVSMFHDNAGVWDFYDGYAIAIKAETHNGPSAISAYFGQLTKLGGVLRDILGTGLGADPIGCFEYTATGLLDAPPPIVGRPGARQIAHDTIQAIKEYGNTFGVPMMWSRMAFHPGYRAKPFALGGSIGVLPSWAAQRGQPRSGDLVVLIGGLTGNEGIHGASASSAGGEMDIAAVQIGAPLEQVKFRKALIELRDEHCLSALTDIGGAGLNSAVGEIGDPLGVWINTALVPLKTSVLPMWRILLSESQERMLLAVPPTCYESAQRILRRHLVRTTVIGRFVDTGRYCVFHSLDLDERAVIASPDGAVPADRGEVGFDVPYKLLDLPIEVHNVGAPPEPAVGNDPWPDWRQDWLADLLTDVVSDPDVASQHYADAQYDTTVQGNTVYGPQFGAHTAVPSGYWACTPVAGNPAAVVFATAFNPWLFQLHPIRALRQSFVSLLSSQVLAGVEPNDICVCDNFYTPHLTEHWREWLVAMVGELASLVRYFGVPVISGKDSSAGSTQTGEGVVSVPHTVFLSGLGKVPDHAGLLGEAWTTAGSLLVRIGLPTPSPAGTVAGRVLGIGAGAVDEVQLGQVDEFIAALRDRRALFRSGSRIGPGGVAARLVVGVLASGFGVALEPGAAGLGELFAEHRLGALVEIDPADLAALPADLQPVVIGHLTSDGRIDANGRDLLTSRVRQAWMSAFSELLA